MVAGPERRTLVEFVIGVIPLPYVLSSILVVVLWSLGNSLAIGLSLGLTLLDALTGWAELVLSPGFVVFLFFIFYVFYAPRFMRLKLIQSKNSISTLLPNGEEDYNILFGGISFSKPSLLFWAFLAVGINLLFVLNPQPERPPLVSLTIIVGNEVVVGLFTLGMSSLIWAYASSLRGIRRMGKMRLRLQQFHRDRYLGLRPMGSLSLALAIVYFAFVGILTAINILFEGTFGFFVLSSFLLAVGLLLFFLPLLRLHQRMLEQKKIDRDKLQEESAPVFEAPVKSLSQDDLSRAFLLDMRRKEVSSIASWPFDTSILAKLTVIVLSVAAALIARYIATLLNI